ncbi:diaminobutyrate acetyltransferase [Pseudobythopirellula maris]|uniref:diaminobutyrate acetyltransferase n=1 Tax=Pseudobythopirellula maris TaxID=2527991 RepID=UPI0018D3638B|nr:diaminobutyrate acetyltransferase [Pseudobythopirellula maris]
MRCAAKADAGEIERLVRDSGVLDVNSLYAYLLLCDHFGQTCLVAERASGEPGAADGLAGFLTSYLPPAKPGVAFVWQVGVADWARKQGLAKRLLGRLIGLPELAETRYLETTITDSNLASRRLFTSFAEQIGASVRNDTGYTTADLGGEHEAEKLYRIGPLPADRSPFKEL